MNLPGSPEDLSCHMLWLRRCWWRQGFLERSTLILCPLRLHVDTDLDERVQYILKTYEYICKVGSTLIFLLLTTVQDETNFARILSTVEKYAGKRSGESWEDLQSRSNYKELVTEPTQDISRRMIFSQASDMREVHDLISRLASGGTDLPAHLFLIAPKIDFRQISAPNFLTDC